MGVTFIGIATKAKERDLLNAFRDSLIKDKKSSEIIYDSEHSFDTIILRKPADDLIDIYSCENGSLCTVSYNVYEYYLNCYNLSNLADVLYFDVCETSMEHRFAFFSGGSEQYGMNVYDEGDTKRIRGNNFLNIRDSYDIFTGTFADAVSMYLPDVFGEMLNKGESEKVRRYKLIHQTPINEDKPIITRKKKSFFQKLFNK